MREKKPPKNHKYQIKGDYEFTSKPATPKELKDARSKAIKLMKKDPMNVAWRSCWQCNGAHAHFLRGKWGNWVLNCFECEKFYFDKIDITES